MRIKRLLLEKQPTFTKVLQHMCVKQFLKTEIELFSSSHIN